VAGPSIMVRVLGDLSALGKSFDGAATQGQSAAGKMHSAFSGMLGTLNASGVLGPFGAALATADQSLQNMEGHMKSTSTTLMGLGGVAMGAGMALQAAGSKDQAAHQQLQSAVAATGHSYDQYAGKVEAAITHQEHFGTTANVTMNAMQSLTTATGSPAKALQLLNTASDLAAAKHISLAEAAGMVGKAYNGNAKIFKEFGVTTGSTSTATKTLTADTKLAETADKSLASAKQALLIKETADSGAKKVTASMALSLQLAEQKVQTATVASTAAHNKEAAAHKLVASGASTNAKALDDLSKKLSGQAAAAASTFGGHLAEIKAKIEDQVAVIGQKYGPALTGIGAGLTAIGSVMKIVQAGQELLRGAQVAATVATDAETVSSDALNVSLLANPLTLIIVGIVAAVAVLIGVIVLIITHFNTFKHDATVAFDAVWNAAKFAYDWLATNWPTVLAILTGPFGLAVLLIIKNWGAIVDFFTGLPGDILTALGDLTHLLEQVGKDLLNGFLAGMDWVWTNLILPYLNFYLRIPIVIGDLLHVLEQLGKDVITGFYNGMVWLWNNVVVGWLNLGQAAKNAVGDLTGWLAGAGQALINGLLAGAQWVWNTGVKTWIGGLGADVTTWAAHMWDGVANGFKAAINAVINGWDALKFTLPSVDTHIPGVGTIGGFTIGVPHIQPLAEGGIITKTGLFLGHAGEAVTPLTSNTFGPAVSIGHAHFHNDVDVDAVMRRAAWLARTRSGIRP
jgi:hypothetical protein